MAKTQTLLLCCALLFAVPNILVRASDDSNDVFSFELQKSTKEDRYPFAVKAVANVDQLGSNEEGTSKKIASDGDIVSKGIPFEVNIGPKSQDTIESNSTRFIVHGHRATYFGSEDEEPEPSRKAALSFSPASTDVFNIGPDSTIMASTDSGDSKQVETVPFAFQLGMWQSIAKTELHTLGSIMFGGYYDRKRVTSGYWLVLYETLNGKSNFLKDGTRKAAFLVSQGPLSRNMTTTLDINSESMVLGGGFKCSDTRIGFIPRDSVDDNIFEPLYYHGDSGLENPSRYCRESDKDEITLGRPFFSNVYSFVDRTGAVFMTNGARDFFHRSRPEPELWSDVHKEVQISNWNSRPRDDTSAAPSALVLRTSKHICVSIVVTILPALSSFGGFLF